MSSPSEIVAKIASRDLQENGAGTNPDHETTTQLLIVDGEAEEILRLLATERLLGVAAALVARADLNASPQVLDQLIAAHDEAMAQTMRVELMTATASESLTSAGISHRLLKGSALAHHVYEDPAQRSFRDVDLLVEGENLAEAIELFVARGAERLQPQLRHDFDSRFGKSVTLRLDDVEVDLHRTVCAGPFGVWARPTDLFLIKRTLDLAGVPVPTLDSTDHLLHACYHVALGSPAPTIVNLRDVALLAAGAWDVERFGQAVSRWRGAAVIRRAVRLVEAGLLIDLPDALASYRHGSVDAAEIAALDPYLTDDPSGRFAALVPATLRALPMRDRAAFARAVGLPDGTDPAERLKSFAKRRRR